MATGEIRLLNEELARNRQLFTESLQTLKQFNKTLASIKTPQGLLDLTTSLTTVQQNAARSGQQLTTTTQKLTAEQREQIRQTKALENQTARLAAANSDTNKELIAQREATNRLNKEIRQSVKDTQELDSEYENLRRRARLASQEALELGASLGINSEEAIAAAQSASELNQEVRDLRLSIGDTTANVGGYTNSIIEALSQTQILGVNVGETANSFRSSVAAQQASNAATSSGIRATQGFAAAQVVLNAILALNPFVLVAAAVVALIAVLSRIQPVVDVISLGFKTLSVFVSNLTSRFADFASGVALIFSGNPAAGFDKISRSVDGLEDSFSAAFEAATRLRDIQILLERSTAGATIEIANLTSELEIQRQAADDATLSIERRQQASIAASILETRIATQQATLVNLAFSQLLLDTRSSIGQLNTEGQQALTQFISGNRDTAIFELLEGLNVSRDVLQSIADLQAEATSASSNITQIGAQSATELRELAQDQAQLTIDALQDTFDSFRTGQERILNVEQRTATQRLRIITDLENQGRDSLNRQIGVIQEFTNSQIDADSLINESNQQVLNERIRSFGLSEQLESRLIQIIMENRAAISELNELSIDELRRINEAENSLASARIAISRESNQAIIDNETEALNVRIQALNNRIQLDREQAILERDLAIANSSGLIDELVQIEEEYQATLTNISLSGEDERLSILESSLDNEINAITTRQETRIALIKADGINRGLAQEEIEENILNVNREALNQQIFLLDEEIERRKEAGEETLELEKALSAAILALAEETNEGVAQSFFERNEAIISASMNLATEIGNIFKALSDGIIQGYEDQIEANKETTSEAIRLSNESEVLRKENLQAQITDNTTEDEAEVIRQQLQVDNSAQLDRIREQSAQREVDLNIRIARERRRRAVLEKAAALAQAAINTAVAITEAAPNPVLIALAAATGAIQLGIIASQPIPAFKDGTDSAPKGLAIVGDGGQQEVIRDRQGNLSLTPSTSTFVNLKGGEEIFPSLGAFSDSLGLDGLMSSIMMNDLNIKAPEVNNQINVALDNETTNQILRKLVKVMSNNQTTTLVKSEKSRKTWR